MTRGGWLSAAGAMSRRLLGMNPAVQLQCRGGSDGSMTAFEEALAEVGGGQGAHDGPDAVEQGRGREAGRENGQGRAGRSTDEGKGAARRVRRGRRRSGRRVSAFRRRDDEIEERREAQEEQHGELDIEVSAQRSDLV